MGQHPAIALAALILALPLMAGAEGDSRPRGDRVTITVGDPPATPDRSNIGVRRERPQPPDRPRPNRPHRYPGIVVIERDPLPSLRPERPPPPPPAAMPEPEPEPAAPPPATGPGRRLPARGAALPAPVLKPGLPVPAGLPHVALDWRTHDLPEPPPGQGWARVDRKVLRLVLATREIVEIRR